MFTNHLSWKIESFCIETFVDRNCNYTLGNVWIRYINRCLMRPISLSKVNRNWFNSETNSSFKLTFWVLHKNIKRWVTTTCWLEKFKNHNENVDIYFALKTLILQIGGRKINKTSTKFERRLNLDGLTFLSAIAVITQRIREYWSFVYN